MAAMSGDYAIFFGYVGVWWLCLFLVLATFVASANSLRPACSKEMWTVHAVACLHPVYCHTPLICISISAWCCFQPCGSIFLNVSLTNFMMRSIEDGCIEEGYLSYGNYSDLFFRSELFFPCCAVQRSCCAVVISAQWYQCLSLMEKIILTFDTVSYATCSRKDAALQHWFFVSLSIQWLPWSIWILFLNISPAQVWFWNFTDVPFLLPKWATGPSELAWQALHC